MRGQDRRVYVKQQRRDGKGWSAWHGVAVESTSSPVVRLNGAGVVEVYYRDRKGTLMVSYQEEPNADAYTDWVPVDATLPAMAEIPDFLESREGLRVITTTAGGALTHGFHDDQKRTFGSMSRDTSGFVIAGRPSATVAGDGRVLVFARSMKDNALYYRHTEVGQPGVWSKWRSLGGRLNQSPKAVTLRDGRVQVFVSSWDGIVRHRITDYEKGWSTWKSIVGANLLATPKIAIDKDGFVHVFGIHKNGRVLENIQNKEATVFGGWRDIGTYQVE